MLTSINQGNNSRASGRDYFEKLNVNYPKLKLINKKYKAKKLSYFQFMFLFFFRFILLCCVIMLLLLPFLSENQDKISFWVFGGVIVVFILLSNWLWKNKIYENKN